MVGSVVILALAASSLMTLYLLESMWRGRGKIPCMTGMMVAMMAGMITGLMGGTVAAVLMKGPLWPPALAGMLIGIGIGVAVGAPVSLMAVLDGGQAGLMGGLMGAMLGAMAPESMTAIAIFLAVTYLVGTVLLILILQGEGWSGPGRWRWGIGALTLMVFALALLRSPTGSTKTLQVIATDNSFAPQVMRLTRGEPVRLMLQNNGRSEHRLLIQGLEARVITPGRQKGIAASARPGGTDVIEFVPLRSGRYEAVCTMPGMRLTIIIEG